MLLTEEQATGSNPGFGFEHGGHSDRVTPEPFPNSVDKPVRVPCCTQMRELSGNMDRCHVHLTSFNFNLEHERLNDCYSIIKS